MFSFYIAYFASPFPLAMLLWYGIFSVASNDVAKHLSGLKKRKSTISLCVERSSRDRLGTTVFVGIQPFLKGLGSYFSGSMFKANSVQILPPGNYFTDQISRVWHAVETKRWRHVLFLNIRTAIPGNLIFVPNSFL